MTRISLFLYFVNHISYDEVLTTFNDNSLIYTVQYSKYSIENSVHKCA